MVTALPPAPKGDVGMAPSLGSAQGTVIVNMVLNVHRNHKAYKGRGEGGGGMEVGEEGAYIPVATLSPPE